jgi:hypothetical protein
MKLSTPNFIMNFVFMCALQDVAFISRKTIRRILALFMLKRARKMSLRLTSPLRGQLRVAAERCLVSLSCYNHCIRVITSGECWFRGQFVRKRSNVKLPTIATQCWGYHHHQAAVVRKWNIYFIFLHFQLPGGALPTRQEHSPLVITPFR